MPLHDWTDERDWDSVHPFWLAYLVEWVQPRLPGGYRAYLGGVPALTVAAGGGRPDVGVRRWRPTAPPAAPSAPAAEAVAPSAGTAVLEADLEPDFETPAAVRLDPQSAIHIDLDGRLVAVVEVVSPRNKDRDAARATYAGRYLGYLRLGVHLMLLDVLPRPRGFSFADAITADLGLEWPLLPPPFAAVYRVGEAVPGDEAATNLVGGWHRPLAAGGPLPRLLLPLNVRQAVEVNLEETYRRAAERAYLD